MDGEEILNKFYNQELLNTVLNFNNFFLYIGIHKYNKQWLQSKSNKYLLNSYGPQTNLVLKLSKGLKPINKLNEAAMQS